MNWIKINIWHPIVKTWQEKRWFSNLMSAVLGTIAITLLYDVLKEIGGLLGTLIILLSIALIIFGAVILTQRRAPGSPPEIIDKPSPTLSQGLIILVSNSATAHCAIEYHLKKLQCCWLITTLEMESVAEEIKTQYANKISRIIIRQIKDRYDTPGCFELIRDIYQAEAPRLGYEPKHIVADITGGTKPMTVGMMLAAMEGEYPIEHIPTEFEPLTGKPIGPLPPIQISIDVPFWTPSS